MPEDLIPTPEPGQAPVPSAQPAAYAALYQTPEPQAAPASQFDPAAFKTELLSAVTELIQGAKPTASAVPEPPAEDWLALMNAGKREEGERALAQRMYKLSGTENALGSAQSAAVSEALARFNAFQEVQSYTQSLRSDPANAAVLVMEPFITASVERKIAAMGDQIKSPQDYVKVYKATVKAEMENARNLVLSIRGEGAQGAAVRQATVLASPHLAPTAMDAARGAAPVPTEPAVETPTDYMLARAAASARNKGLSAN